jgi:hypothetical protein
MVKDLPFDSAQGTHAALHNRLNLLESRSSGRFQNDSSCGADDSSRLNRAGVVFVNHPEALSPTPSRNGQYVWRAGGWGAPILKESDAMTQGHRVELGAGNDDAGFGRHDGNVP